MVRRHSRHSPHSRHDSFFRNIAVSHSLLIRAAVKLCLIAVMVTQPMMVFAAQADCAPSCSQVTNPAVGCCCGDSLTNALPRSGCRVSQEGSPRCCSDKAAEPASKHQADRSSAADSQGLDKRIATASCNCGLHSEPVAPAPSRSPLPQPRDLIAIAYLDASSDVLGLGLRPMHLDALRPIGARATHFSQQFLCIWRL